MDEIKNDPVSQPSQVTGDDDQLSGARRRGDILENAILQAAWDELGEVGYALLTMEKIAARAKTNKTAVYRRWPNKAKIVVAAIIKHVPKPELASFTPDTGDLRKDVFILLQGIAKPLQTIGAETMHGLMVEYHGKDLISSLPELMRPRSEDKLTAAMKSILKNAEKRGELSLETINARVIALPADLLRYEILTTHEPVTDETLIGIVDDVFLPLVIAK
ncbi:TetR/AcrR family transcriptional regulator [Paenibacillus sp. FSL H7-0357]|uniref:TetR/AcrR family transcriptional regulator n=1 Tax=Paenibacillus sp. FSL H7-0357 TaxID=1536774 RepID=UPI00068BC3CB|nr:TetR/AcrR family transcriptional regulator [Paenibacillus sp. FSL H7-0357]